MKNLIVWKISTGNINTASIRYRCLIPICEINEKYSQYEHLVLTDHTFYDVQFVPEVIVFVKSYLNSDVLLAQEMKAKGVYIVFEFCDNVLESYRDDDFKANFKRMVDLCDTLTVPTLSLAQSYETLLDEKSRKKIQIIPDPVETLKHIRFSKKIMSFRNLKNLWWFLRTQKSTFIRLRLMGLMLKSYLVFFYNLYLFFIFSLFKKSRIEEIISPESTHENKVFLFEKVVLFPYMVPEALLKLASKGRLRFSKGANYKFLKRSYFSYQKKSGYFFWFFEKMSIFRFNLSTAQTSKDGINLLWFGVGGIKGSFGLTDLLEIKSDLQELHKDQPVVLTVVSNNYQIFCQVSRELSIPCRYIPWSLEIMESVFKKTDVTLVPNPLNNYTKGKSSNRTILSLSHDVPVVATWTQDLEHFSGAVLFGSWKDSILKYVRDQNFRRSHLNMAKDIINNSHYSPNIVSQNWHNIFSKAGLRL